MIMPRFKFWQSDYQDCLRFYCTDLVSIYYLSVMKSKELTVHFLFTSNSHSIHIIGNFIAPLTNPF